MNIYTSYFANVKNLPNTVVPISISLWNPRDYSGISYKDLAHTKAILLRYKENEDIEEYCKEYSKVLDKLTLNTVLEELSYLSNGKDICLVCYEGKGKFCHRHLVKRWIECNSNYKVKEY